MGRIKVDDFKLIKLDDYTGYYSYQDPKHEIEICLEACFDGYDVAIYEGGNTNEPKFALLPKYCTHLGKSLGLGMGMQDQITIKQIGGMKAVFLVEQILEILDKTKTFDLVDHWTAEYETEIRKYTYELSDPEKETNPNRKVKLELLEMALRDIAIELNFYIKE